MSSITPLIHSYINGDNHAVAELYTCLKDRLLLLAYNHCRNKEISHDIVQDVFEKMLVFPNEKRKEYFGDAHGNIEAYLSVAVRNKCIDIKKNNTNREKIIYSIRHIFITKVDNASHERFCQDGLRQMLLNLQPREQEIIRLHLDGYTNDEIATQLNITYNTVKNNIYEARQKLKILWNLFMI